LNIRLNARLLSSVLFTVAFLWLLPIEVKNSLSFDEYARALPSSTLVMNVRLFRDLGVVSLAVILSGLIVTWAGYATHVRWTWFVMFIIVSLWAFPLLLLPLLGNSVALTAGEWVREAFRRPGIARGALEQVVIFYIMLIALLLPVPSFFLKKKTPSEVSRLPRVSA
jgi:hypothetical protein